MLVSGRNNVKEILKNFKGDLEIKKLICQNNYNEQDVLSLAKTKKIPIFYKEKRDLDNLVKNNHQGVVLEISDFNYTPLEELLGKDRSFLLILDHLEDPHNLGAIVRTCEAAGVDGIIIPSDREVLVNPTVIKTSVGTAYDVNIIKVVNLVDTIKLLKDNGYWIVGTSLMTDTDYKDVDYSGNICLVIGNEAKGMSHLVSKNCDYNVKIPMYGKTNSLNASVAAGIMIYEIIGNRKR